MALQTKRSFKITGNSMIDGVQAVHFNSEINEVTGESVISQNITNLDVYNANKAICRADQEAFQKEVWELEDKISATEE